MKRGLITKITILSLIIGSVFYLPQTSASRLKVQMGLHNKPDKFCLISNGKYDKILNLNKEEDKNIVLDTLNDHREYLSSTLHIINIPCFFDYPKNIMGINHYKSCGNINQREKSIPQESNSNLKRSHSENSIDKRLVSIDFPESKVIYLGSKYILERVSPHNYFIKNIVNINNHAFNFSIQPSNSCDSFPSSIPIAISKPANLTIQGKKTKNVEAISYISSLDFRDKTINLKSNNEFTYLRKTNDRPYTAD